MLIYARPFMLLIIQLTGAASEKTSESQQHVQHDFSKMESMAEAFHERTRVQMFTRCRGLYSPMESVNSRLWPGMNANVQTTSSLNFDTEHRELAP